MAPIGRSTDQVPGHGRTEPPDGPSPTTSAAIANAPSDRSGTRGRILEAAIDRLAEVGWADVTTRGIAARAGVNVALLHYHFESKEALLREAMLAALEGLFASVAEPLLGPLPLLEALDQVADRMAAIDMTSPVAVVLGEALLRATRDDAIRAPMSGELSAFRELVAARIVAAGPELRAGLDAEGTAIVIAALLDGLFFHVFVDPSLDLRRARRAVRALLEPGPDRP